MSGYPEGKHDDPADTQDRLVRVGAKYQSSAPTLTDGDNAYLLVDSAGRVIVVGPAAEDAAVVGSPLLAGGRYDATDRTLDDGDVGGIALDAAGRVKVTGPSANAPVAAMVGASEVKVKQDDIGATSATRATFLTPTSGKKVRVVSVQISTFGLTTNPDCVYVYFGTGAAYATNDTKCISAGNPGLNGSYFRQWPDGAGPGGAVDDVVSWRTQTETETALRVALIYREE